VKEREITKRGNDKAIQLLTDYLNIKEQIDRECEEMKWVVLRNCHLWISEVNYTKANCLLKWLLKDYKHKKDTHVEICYEIG
jgi:hypothetical protein